jgi:hypothetical protein
MSTLIKSFKEVFKKPSYVILALAVAFVVFLISIWLPSWEWLYFVFTSKIFNFPDKIKLFWSSLDLVKTNFTLISRMFVICLSLLAGINIAMLTFYLKRRIVLQKTAGIGLLGIISGFLGIGCASCGSVIFPSILGVTVASSFISILPLKGFEFGILGIIIILVSIYLIARKIQSPLACKLNVKSVQSANKLNK